MKTIAVKNHECIQFNGRFDPSLPGFPMMWSGAGAEMTVEGSHLEVQIDCRYTSMAPYLSFTVDGVRSQVFVPQKGKHWYPVFLNLSHASHRVRIAKETQPFGGDTDAYVNLIALRTNGHLAMPDNKKMRIEFIGDSITSGEGCKGPVSFMEWVPMVFSSSDTYARMTADKLNARYQVISQSGWGVLGAWDNNPSGSIPGIYTKICGPVNAQNGQQEYDFSFNPDKIVIALGTNDAGAVNSPAYTDPVTGATHKLTDSPEDMERLTQACCQFIDLLHEKNPSAQLYWIVFYDQGPIHDAIKAAVERKQAEVGIRFAVPLTLDGMSKQEMGSRAHPGVKAHEKISKALVKLLKE